MDKSKSRHPEHGSFKLTPIINQGYVTTSYGNSLSPGIVVTNTIKVQKDYFSRIDEVRKELRNTEHGFHRVAG